MVVNLMVVGVSHRTASLRVRERFSFTRKRIEESLIALKHSGFVLGAAILSTCNRTEIYAHIEEAPEIPGSFSKHKLLVDFIFNIYQAGENDRERYFYILKDTDAVRHIFRVASGLDSQVLGETQILAQVRSNWIMAKNIGATSNRLDEVFERAQEVGKIVRSDTKISQGNVSIGSVAIKTLENKFKSLKKCSVLIIGAGKIGTLVSKYLKEKNIKGIFVANRTYLRAVELAANCRGKAVGFGRLEQELQDVDIVISCTLSPHIILKREMLAAVMQNRIRPLFIMDLALPRDVDSSVRDIPGVSLYDLDDLKCVVAQNHKTRESEAVFAERIAQNELNKFCIINVDKCKNDGILSVQ